MFQLTLKLYEYNMKTINLRGRAVQSGNVEWGSNGKHVASEIKNASENNTYN